MKRSMILLFICALCLSQLMGCGEPDSPSAEATTPVSTAETTKSSEENIPEASALLETSVAESDMLEASSALELDPDADTASPLAQEVFGDAQPQDWSLPLGDGSQELSLVVTFAADKLQNYCPNGTEDFEIFKAAEEITGVQVSIRSLSTSASAEQFPIMIASGDYPDMVGWGLQYNGGNELAVDEGVYLDLVDIIAEYAPNYMKVLSSDDALLDSALSDKGYITNFFALQTEDSLGTFGPVIRTDLLEEAGLDKPYTVEEYETVLTAFKDMGVAEPLVLMSTGCAPNNFLAGAYGISAYQCTFPMTVAPFYVENASIKYGLVEDGYQDYMALIQDWLSKGLIDKEFVINNQNWNSADYATKVLTGQAGLFYTDKGNIAGYNSGSEINGFRVEATYDAHLTEDSVNHFASVTKKSAGNGISITDNCQNIELAAQWCDWWYTEEASLLANYGVEGISYEMVDGKPKFTDLVRNFELGTRDALMIYASNNTICCIIDSKAVDSLYEPEDVEAPEIWAKGCDDAFVIPQSVTMNSDENDIYTAKYADIATYVEENVTKFLTGDKAMDQWEGFVQGLWDMGLQDCIDAYQSAYDRATA